MSGKNKMIVRKANDLIEARYKLTVEENRLVHYLISQIEPEDEEFKRYNITVSEFCLYTGLRADNVYGSFMEICKGLLSKPMLLYQGGTKTILNWLAEATYHEGDGRMTLIFSPALKPYLLKIKKDFTMYNLSSMVKLRSIHSCRLYELLKQYVKIGHRTFLLEDLKAYLCVSDSYKDYYNFKKYVILAAQKEISAKCDIRFEFQEIKESHKVVWIKFFIGELEKIENGGAVHTAAEEQLLIGAAPAAAQPAPAHPAAAPVIELRQIMSFIREPISNQQYLDIYEAAKGNLEYIRQRYYEVTDNIHDIRDITATLIWAVRKTDISFEKIPSSQADPGGAPSNRPKPAKPPEKINRFCNFNQRRNDYDELEKLEYEQFVQSIKK